MKKNFIWIIILLLCQTILFAQKEIIQSDTAKNGVVKFQRYNTSLNPRLTVNEKDVLKQTLKMASNDSLRLEKTIDTGNYSHKVYQQFYKGYQVVGGTYATHEKNGKIESINGFFQKVGNPNVKPTINEQTALNKALALIGAKKYGWDDEFTENRYRELMKDSSATLKPKGELLIIFDDSITQSYRLAYKFHIYAVTPLVNKNVYIDAISGNIIDVENLIQDANVAGTAMTLYSKKQNITMDSYSSPIMYRLQETRTTNGKTAQIQTFNMQNGGSYNPQNDFSNSTTNWTTADAGLDAHWGAEKVFDYWSTVRKRNSYDDLGSPLVGYVHANLPAISSQYKNNDNAFWDPTMQTMTYGDGTVGGAEVSIDIIGHEIAHGICRNTPANLSASGESGALNEGLSDIWGAVITNYADPSKQIWLHNFEINYDIRSLSNPKSYSYPDTYKGTNWSSTNDPHTNSTVLSHWFYLLSQGGSGANDLKNSYSVTGIGITEAANIVWNAESTGRLQPQSKYTDARTAMINAATDLYKEGSQEVISVTNAWYAVGVGEKYKSPYTISGPDIVCSGSSGLFIINNFPAGATVTWTSPFINGGGGVSLTPGTGANQNKVTVSVNSSALGDAKIRAVINGGDVVEKAFTANFPITTGKMINLSTNQTYSLNLPRNSDITGYTWKWSNTTGVYYNIYYDEVKFSNSGNYTLNLYMQNKCGTSVQPSFTYTFIVGGSSYSMATVYPNPVSDVLNIDIETPDVSQAAQFAQSTGSGVNTNSTSATFEIRLYDSNGKLMQQKKVKPGKAQLNISHLHNGNYFLHIYDGVNGIPEINQIVVKH